MSIQTSIKGGGSGATAKVTSRGELVIGRLAFNSAYNATAGTANAAVNLVTPVSGKQFVIDQILLYANLNVSNVTDATVVLYEATSPSTTTVSKTILTTEMVRFDRIIFNQTNLIVSEGVWVNIKTTDDDIDATIFGYYVDIDGE